MISPQEIHPNVRPGDVLAGKYRVERVLGVGGMGVVVAAHHIQLDEKVALKFLLPAALASPDALARFEREARAAVKIKSEHVARVSDVGRLENGAPYMVMEYLEGGDLQDMLRKGGPLPVEQAVEFVLQACEAIVEAHVLGIVHRDLKPSNLFVVRRADGLLSVKVLDFGISKVSTGGADMGMTRTAAIIGSPVYMSPEQMQSSKGVDARTDIWSLGVILFELVTGSVPFDAETITELAVKVCTEAAPQLRALRPNLPAELESATTRCLAKAREERFADVGELALALRPLASPHAMVSVDRILRTMSAAGVGRAPVDSRPSLAQAETVDANAKAKVATASSWGTTGGGAAPARRKRPGRLVGTAVAGAALVGLIATWALVARRHAGAPAAPAAAHAGAASVDPGASASSPGVAAAATLGTAPTELPARAPVAAAISAQGASASAVASAGAPAKAPRPVAGAAPAAPRPRIAAPPTIPPAAPTAKPNCNPPYFIDSAGHRQYKPECL